MRTLLKILFVLLIALSYVVLSAQKDSVYIDETAETFTFGVHLKYRNNNAILALNNDEHFVIHDEALLAGIRLRYKWLSSVLSVPIIDDIRNTGSIRPATYSVTARAYPTHFYGQLNAQFVSLSKESLITFFDRSFAALEEAYIAQANALLVYGFNKDKLSMSAAYSFFERQNKSVGCWLLAGQFDGTWWHLPEAQWEEWEEDRLDFDRFNTYRYMLGGGYSYSLVYKSFCANIMATTGVEFVSSVRKDTNEMQEIDRTSSFRYVPLPRLMGSIVHYFSDYYIAMTAEYTADSTPEKLYHTRLRGGFVRMSFGRFL